MLRRSRCIQIFLYTVCKMLSWVRYWVRVFANRSLSYDTFRCGTIGCKDRKTSSWHLIRLPDGGSIGPTVYCRGKAHRDIVRFYINRLAGTPDKTKTKATMSLDTAQFCYIGPRIGWVSTLLYYHISGGATLCKQQQLYSKS